MSKTVWNEVMHEIKSGFSFCRNHKWRLWWKDAIVCEFFHINFSTLKNSWILSIVFSCISAPKDHIIFHISIADNREIFIKLSCVIQGEQMCGHISSCMPVFSFKEIQSFKPSFRFMFENKRNKVDFLHEEGFFCFQAFFRTFSFYFSHGSVGVTKA